MNLSHAFFCAALACACLQPLSAQVPDQLAHAIPAPATGSQSGLRQGSAVASSTTYLIVGAPYDDQATVDAGSVRVYDATTGALLHMIPNPDPDSIELFGNQVALSGDRLVVGSLDRTLSFDQQYFVHLFDLGGATPTVPQYAFDEGGFSFGSSFAIDGDRLVVSAPDDLSVWTSYYNTVELGRLFVFDLVGGTPEVSSLVIDGPATGTHVGECLALDGDLLVAGGGSSAWVYDLGSGTPTTPIEELEHPDGLTLGTSADLKDPYVILSNRYENNSEGAAYVYDLSRLNPSIPLAELNDPTPLYSSYFGAEVAIATTKVVVGCPGDGTDRDGSVFVFDLTAPDPTVPFLTIENPGSGYYDDFGESIALTGAKVLVGTPRSDLDSPDGGRTYFYDLSAADPQVAVFALSDTGHELLKEFGKAVALSGSYLAVGSPFDDAATTNVGSVHLYDLEGGTPTVPYFTAPHPDPQEGALFGIAVDLNGRYLAVSATEQDVGSENDAGTVYIFDTLGSNPATPIHTLVEDVPDNDFSFGSSVALNDDWIVVAAPDYGSGLFPSSDGRVHIYDFSNPSTPVATLIETPDHGNAFGTDIALDGDRLAIGATDGDLEYGGWTYVYDLGSANPTTPVHSFPNPNTPVIASSPLNEGLFGFNVALSGDWLAIGGLNAAYLYDLSAANPEASMIKAVFIATTLYETEIPYTGLYRVALNNDALIVAVEGYNGFVKAFDLTSAQPLNSPEDIAPGIIALSAYTALPLAMEGARLAVGVPKDDQAGTDNGAVYVFDRSPTPEISVSAKEESLESGTSTVRIGLGTLGVSTPPIVVTVRNVGGAPLTGLALSKAGPHTGDFLLDTSGMAAGLAIGEETSFSITFNATGTSLRQAQLRIASNDADENPFTFEMAGWSLSAEDDTDGDGLNDLAELQLAPFGFDWQDPQPALVSVLFDNANLADLFTSSQIGALSVNGVIGQNPANGNFLLTIGVRKSTDHETYDPLPMSDADTQINPDGKLEFQFTVPEDTAFFELEAE